MEKLYIDAGGTKVAGYLITKDSIFKKVINEPGNINTNYEKAKKNIISVLTCFDLSIDKEVKIGAAGATGNKLLASKLQNELKQQFPNHSFSVLGDLDLTCQLIEDDNYLFVNCGTGTVAIHHENHQNTLYLGWGKLVNDLGSGYDIGIHFIKFLTYCEDKRNENPIYLKFISEYNLASIRDFIPIITSNPKEISKVSLWLSQQDETTINLFIIERIKKLFKYLSFVEFNNLYLTGSIFEKNKNVQAFVLHHFANKKIEFVNFENLLERKYF